jgi:hypothetical protein
MDQNELLEVIRDIGNEQLEYFIRIAEDNGLKEVAENLRKIYTDGDWDDISDIPVQVSRAYMKYIKGVMK